MALNWLWPMINHGMGLLFSCAESPLNCSSSKCPCSCPFWGGFSMVGLAAEPPLLLGDARWGRGAEGWESGDPSSTQISWASINSMSMQWATMSSWRQKSPWELEEASGELQVRNSSTWLPLPCTQSCLGPVKLVAFYTLHRLNKGAKRRNEMFLSFVHVIVRASDLCQRNQVQRGHHSALVGLSQKQRPQQLQTFGFLIEKGLRVAWRKE